MKMNLTIDKLLQERFGFSTFRQGQREAIATLLSHGTLLSIQPTGHGKSLLYQLPTLLLPGMTLVISPLLALMRDQMQQLKSRFGISAATINSDQEEEENETARQESAAGRIKVLFIAPEQLDHVDRFDFLLQLPITLLVIDEAHCISTWGHDFRPSYRQIVHFAEAMQRRTPSLHILALTATANQKVEEDIQAQLTLGNRRLTIQRQTMNRPNLRLTIMVRNGVAHKLLACERLLHQLQGSGLIYCATREHSELVAEYLQSRAINCLAYHAGLTSARKLTIQQDFLEDHCPLIAATNALGMGIDKPNIRFIIHFDHPGSITAYYQEVGRAGRDGNSADAILLYDPADKQIQDYFIHSSQPDREDFIAVMEVVRNNPTAPHQAVIKTNTGLHPTRITVVLAELVEQGFLIKRSQSGRQVYEATTKEGSPLLDRYERQKWLKSRELALMTHYATGSLPCSMAFLRETLGEVTSEPCGHCHRCNSSPFFVQEEENALAMVNSWLTQRPVPLAGIAQLRLTAGLSLYDGKLRHPSFVTFMNERSTLPPVIDQELYDALVVLITKMKQEHDAKSLIALPSRGWAGRESLVRRLVQEVPLRYSLDYLRWREEPLHRQEELLNNDQRKENVDKRMTVNPHSQPPPGTILLFDDYSGSGATLKEATRALRQEGKLQQAIVPVTIAAIKWHLGQPGMV